MVGGVAVEVMVAKAEASTVYIATTHKHTHNTLYEYNDSLYSTYMRSALATGLAH